MRQVLAEALVGVDPITGLDRYNQITQLFVDVAKQRVVGSYDVVLKSPNDVVVEIEQTISFSRLNIDETAVEAPVWLAITNLMTAYLADIAILG